MPIISDRMLPQSVRVERIVRTPNGRGGHTETKTTVATALRCRMTAAFLTQLADVDGQLVSQPTRYAYFDPDADLRPQDILTTPDGRVLIVQAGEVQADGIYFKANLNEEQPA
ncbi:MAG: hypothetical protein RJA36_1437 [Pseudomonadota bacterium]|jgi:hypothetical protein